MKTHLLFIFFAALLLSGCQQKFDQPPLRELQEGSELFVSTIRNRVPRDGQYFRFADGDSCLYCTVIADEASGNLYRQVFARDDAGNSIRLDLVGFGSITLGDRLRVRLERLYAVNANNMIYIDSVDIAKNTVKKSSGHSVQATTIPLTDLLSGSRGTRYHELQSQLIRIPDVEFVPNSSPSTFAFAVSGNSADQNIRNCSGNQITVRTSGFANFAGKMLPAGNGTITAILTQFGDRLQLIIPDYNNVNMNGPLCSVTHPSVTPSVVYLKKDFNDLNLTSGGWTSYTITNGSVNWSVGTFSNTSTPFAKISGYVQGGNRDSECWLISPPMDLSKSTKPYVMFQTAAKFPGNALEILLSSDYVSGLPSTGVWNSPENPYTLSPAPNTGGFVWTPSGKIDLSTWKSPTVRVAFRYSSTAAGATTYELDDILIQED